MTSVFDVLVGQEHIIEILQGAVAASRTGEESQEMTHAWVFTGPPGSGRSSAAVAFAQALICPNNGCGNCKDCNSTKTHGHPDVEIIRTEGLSIKVEEVRELLSRVAWAPSMGGWRVVVMEDADRLTESAANALLKAIEEPGTRTVWLLCAPTLHDVLPTIRSRCRHLQLRTPSLEAVTNVLINRDHIAPGMADFAARVSQGHIGRAKYLATNESVRSNRKTILRLPLQLGSLAAAFQAAQTLVDLATTEANASSDERDEKEVEKLQEAYGKGATGRGMATGGAKAVKELEKEQKLRSTRMVRDSIDGALLDIATFYRDVMMVQSGNTDSIINTDMHEQIESYAFNSPSHSTVNKINAIMEARENLARNSAPLVTCEALMCQLARKYLSTNP
ncbi:DNA polymerase III subunit delta' [Candidatus Planktophila sulfonica]|uniref:DNA polymerase III subunit delta n=1 Tax=Candidatus Planktophila sulfonica TaxID=1884904 RepID=A0A249KEY9_9ACTN|nr:DNA polymerase III subunit delta' [Candidatus Planktophila sulfonica]ASY15362.1 DNA polymerase III subunit delta' [Candidatus Planktophila sulfonica]